MSKPGIESSKRSLPWKTIAGVGAVGVIGAGLLALSQCDGDEQPAPAPEKTETAAPKQEEGPAKYVYRYIVTENAPIRADSSASSAPVIYLKKDSCIEGATTGTGDAVRNGFAQVTAMAANGVDASSGWIAQSSIGNNGIRTPGKTCSAEFIAANTAPESKGGPVQFFSVSGSTNFYVNADETSAPAAMAGDASCVKSTGIQRGNLMQVQVNGDKTYWAATSNFRPAPSNVSDATCNAKLQLNP